jgi:hypothetical protein
LVKKAVDGSLSVPWSAIWDEFEELATTFKTVLS